MNDYDTIRESTATSCMAPSLAGGHIPKLFRKSDCHGATKTTSDRLIFAQSYGENMFSVE